MGKFLDAQPALQLAGWGDGFDRWQRVRSVVRTRRSQEEQCEYKRQNQVKGGCCT